VFFRLPCCVRLFLWRFFVFQFGRSRVVVVVVFVVVVLLVIVVSICFRTTDKHSIVNNNTQFVVLRVVFCFVFVFFS
jgi:hypothetical protein